MQLSVIVPILNEKEQIAPLLRHLQDLQALEGCEVIVVDGGSTDGSVETLQPSGLQLVHAARGRAVQMNAGALVAKGYWLLFLHADSQLPREAFRSISGLEKENVHWGRFDIQIVGNSFWFPLIATLINLRSRFSGIATGDQAIFVRRSLFEAIGGFPAQPLMEDVELSCRLRSYYRPHCFWKKVKTSGRRWEKFGVLRTILLMWRLRFDYWRGVSAERLAKRYE
ncbi:TIGR04283 family arsenosugar biosynthesis glycosyltransferase [Microbulbifer sp. A4B17]|uniref:TIGR04283 family arsenosugar biosynthesis glycosyltransferase n=1 Tax=Microbulbifer sp. A4B17 TaxID=359370 RepID=UPI001863A5F3|nr:TIGR04283 family arsenosugar biosynthesis glycosyltransferase [Microbulbifer sp. A4B17]